MTNRIYADYNATNPVLPEHFDLVCEQLKKVDGNPSSIHGYGREAKIALEDSRENIAKLFACDDQEIIFTSGATEGNNLILQGVIGYQNGVTDISEPRDEMMGVYSKRSSHEDQESANTDEVGGDLHKKPHLIISAAEHASIRVCAETMRDRGLCDLSIAEVDSGGVVKMSSIIEAICEETCLVAIIHANNEVGTINPVFDIAAAVKAINPKIHVHSDSVQALAKLDLTGVSKSKVDSVTVSSHKIGGLKGCGAVYLRRGADMHALVIGGGQERARRPGTENIPGIVSFGIRAQEIIDAPGWLCHCYDLKVKMIEALSRDSRFVLHGDQEHCLPTTVNFHIDGVSGEEIVLNLDLAGIAVSTGSACSSGVARPSSVLTAMGYSDWAALNSIRVSFGNGSTSEHVDKIVRIIGQILARRTA